jgi:hypothetical protein
MNITLTDNKEIKQMPPFANKSGSEAYYKFPQTVFGNAAMELSSTQRVGNGKNHR